MALLDELNEVQRAAVQDTEGPSMIIAGAGSGKTRVITYKIAHLIDKGVDPFSILALTFTNKAAREMRERVEKMLGGTEARNVWLGTFHSIFSRILRIEAEKLGFTRNFTIYDSDDSKSLMRSLIKSQQLDDKRYKVSTILNRISGAKTNLISHVEYNNNQEIMNADAEAGRPKTGLLYTFYQEGLRKANAMDFDDLLFNTNVLFRDFPETLYHYQKRFRYVLVDEYQDTNFSQYLIVKKLAARHENITVVGDDAQSIYAFRGANIQNILNFEKDYPDTRKYKLEQNYRSTKNIVQIANSVINKNKKQFKKSTWTDNAVGEKVKLFSATTDNEEGNMVARRIYELAQRRRRPYSSFAVLYRTNAQSRSMEEGLRRLNVPYRIFGGLSFYQRKEVKDVLGYLRLVVNPDDEEAIKRVINYPRRGIGTTTINKLKVAADNNGLSLWKVMSEVDRYVSLPTATSRKISDFVALIEAARVDLEKKNAYDLAMEVAKASGVLAHLYSERNDDEGVMRFENVEELLNSIKDFSESESGEEGASELRTLPEFMQDIALFTDADEKDKTEGDFVTLMTVHAAKGLEFPFVFIVGMEENLFPGVMSLNSRDDIEEERRLFYVALTRGEEQVFLSMANTRFKWGNFTYCEPSRFLLELDERYLDDETGVLETEQPVTDFQQERRSWTSPKPAAQRSTAKYGKSGDGGQAAQTKKTPVVLPKNKKLKKLSTAAPASANTVADYADIVEGTEVMHARFGQGKVLKTEGSGSNKKALVFFKNVGEKNLILRFAKLERI